MTNNRIYSLDWLKGWMIICIVCYHSYFFPGFRGYLAVDLFFFISGYLLMQSFLHKPKTAVQYTWKRIQQLAAPYFICLFLAICLRRSAFTDVSSFGAWTDLISKALSSASFADEFGAELTRSPFLLGGWFLSVLVIGSFLLYGALQFNERLATTVLFPLVVLFGYNALLGHAESVNNFARIGLLGAPMIRGVFEMAAGVLIGHLVVHHKAGLEKRSLLINIFGVVSFIVFMALMFTKNALDKYLIITIPWIITASVIDGSWLNTALLKLNGGVIARLGRYSLYVYCIHGIAQTIVFAINDQILHHAWGDTTVFFVYLATVAIASLAIYYLSQFITRRIKNRED